VLGLKACATTPGLIQILKGDDSCLPCHWPLVILVSSLYSHPDNIIPDTEDTEPKPMIIGTNNVFEVGCRILCLRSPPDLVPRLLPV
jgi:hypothetical protein